MNKKSLLEMKRVAVTKLQVNVQNLKAHVVVIHVAVAQRNKNIQRQPVSVAWPKPCVIHYRIFL